jgi:hypothetical protein
MVSHLIDALELLLNAFGQLKGIGPVAQPLKFFYLGSPHSVYHPIFFTRKQAGFDSLAKLRAASGIRVGGQSVGFSTYIEGRLFAYVLGLKEPKFVTGYGGAELDPALLRGEIDAPSSGADGILLTPEWLKGGVVDFHSIINIPKGEKRPPSFPREPPKSAWKFFRKPFARPIRILNFTRNIKNSLDRNRRRSYPEIMKRSSKRSRAIPR